MKNRPLSAQLWMMISLLILAVMIIIFGIMNFSVRNFFEKQTFETIEYSQSNRLSNTRKLNSEAIDSVIDDLDTNDDVSQSAQEYERSVNHLVLTQNRLINNDIKQPFGQKLPLVNKIRQTILLQEESSKRYIFKTDQQIYCVVTKAELANQDIYMISYMYETYTRGLINSMNKNIISVLAFSLLFSLIIAQLIARRITKPLEALENQFEHIARKEWQSDLVLNRSDEIGRLAQSANLMQSTLQEQDIEEKNFIQTVSHDLKTPIMVIRSYSQAVLDGIIPVEDIQSSIQLIDTEALKMDEKIKSLIYLYTLRNQTITIEDTQVVNSTDYLSSLIKRFQYTTDMITFSSQLEDVTLNINEKSFTVALENIIENALRFAKSKISISCIQKTQTIDIVIFNDGSSIENSDRIFKRYETESKGNTGLGMAITKEIITHHKGQIIAQNEENGVSFIISLPKLV